MPVGQDDVAHHDLAEPRPVEGGEILGGDPDQAGVPLPERADQAGHLLQAWRFGEGCPHRSESVVVAGSRRPLAPPTTPNSVGQ